MNKAQAFVEYLEKTIIPGLKKINKTWGEKYGEIRADMKSVRLHDCGTPGCHAGFLALADPYLTCLDDINFNEDGVCLGYGYGCTVDQFIQKIPGFFDIEGRKIKEEYWPGVRKPRSFESLFSENGAIYFGLRPYEEVPLTTIIQHWEGFVENCKKEIRRASKKPQQKK